MAAAASGALTMPQAGAHPSASGDPLLSAAGLPVRPQMSTGAIPQPLEDAGEALAAEHVTVAKVAFVAAVEQQRREAAERADREARAAREAQAAQQGQDQAQDGAAPSASRDWVLPVKKFRITAGFGSGGRLWSSSHTGTDFAAPSGTPVMAVGAGEIVKAGSAGAYGNRIIIRHEDGTETWYCHLSRIAQRSGSVGAGEVIGNVGSTGNSTGPHLHLEVRPDGGDPVNPRTWLRSHGLSV
jgi:murein DD-endopeptidase MepM/ murein hydrolase activator NlpD